MAVTRKLLKALGVTDEAAEQILEEHTNTVNEIRAQRDQYKEAADQLPGVQQELAELKTAAEQNADNPYKAQYETVKKQFDEYKADVEAQKAKADMTAAYRKLLEGEKVSDKVIDNILKVTSFDGLELDQSTGQFKNEADLKKQIAQDWSGFIVKEENRSGASILDRGSGNNGGSSSTGGTAKSRAATIAEQYNASLYGVSQEGGK